MKKAYITTLLFTLLIFAFSTPCRGGWLIYHKPEFRGKVIDAETKEPIEGAVVLAIYKKYPIISGPGGGSSSIILIKEALTDKKGEFYISSYTTIIQPLSIEDKTDFIIYKPEYGKYPGLHVSPPPLLSPEYFFSQEFGTKGEKRWRSKTVTFTFGVVKLPRLKTREERLKGLPGYPSDLTSKNSPLFFKTINEEYKRLGLGQVK